MTEALLTRFPVSSRNQLFGRVSEMLGLLIISKVEAHLTLLFWGQIEFA